VAESTRLFFWHFSMFPTLADSGWRFAEAVYRSTSLTSVELVNCLQCLSLLVTEVKKMKHFENNNKKQFTGGRV
jgi:hypothetical protein